MEQKLNNEGVIYEFTPAEVWHLRELVQDLKTVMENDDMGVTVDLVDQIDVCAEILGV